MTTVAAGPEVERQVLAALGEEREEVGDAFGRDLLLEPLGHQRLLRGGELLDLLAEDPVRLALGVEQLDGGLRLGGEQAVEDLAVGRGQGVLDEVPLDAPARVEDVDQQLLARVRAHPGEVGADLAPFAAVGVALGALLGEDDLALRRRRPP